MFSKVNEFEETIARFFDAPYGVATDCCTHAIELCLRVRRTRETSCPTRTYISIPMTLMKLGIRFTWNDDPWQDHYSFRGTDIVDAAPFWKKGGYVPGTLMCLSFQHKKHLSLGRGGMILCADLETRDALERLAYDGRKRHGGPWDQQDIESVGYHYYMTPETAEQGLDRLRYAIDAQPQSWDSSLYPDLRDFSVFRDAS